MTDTLSNLLASEGVLAEFIVGHFHTAKIVRHVPFIINIERFLDIYEVVSPGDFGKDGFRILS